MALPIFNFGRTPSTKVSAKVVLQGLVGADNTLTLIGHIASTPGTAAIGALVPISNYGDPVLAKTEAEGLFGVGSELAQMVVAAISAVLYSDLDSKMFPPIVCLPLANAATSATLAATLSTILNVPAPYIATPYNATDAAAVTAIGNHVTAINANDRGDNGQFGSFAFVATDVDTALATPIAIATANVGVIIPWLRDLATVKSNTPAQVAAACAAMSAALGIPFLPLNGNIIGGLVPPTQSVDWLPASSSGPVELGLDAGLVPLQISPAGKVTISRMVTSIRTVAAVQDVAYFDMQDWQVIYYLRKNCYNIAQQPRYKRSKASIEKLQALKSELIQTCKDMESLEMLQHVNLLVAQFTVNRQPQNRFAAVYSVPINVIPGFQNKGIEIDAGVQFDILVA